MVVSYGLSRAFNILTWSQVRKSAYGDDANEETAVASQEFPVWIRRMPSPIPDSLGDEISSFSNEAASKSLSKFRNAISYLAFSEDEDSRSKVLSEYLSWNELIHNSYFDIPRFRKLVAYAITQADGFRATNQFKNDTDYDVVAKWYDEIQPKESA
ncbi:unnamed protein product [marine sediment metagenome]|uniref:Uncharacterized protein n=1 Tax=marine sediment metagenome TaxID=412755 RepID=X1BG35_9ZZZZ